MDYLYIFLQLILPDVNADALQIVVYAVVGVFWLAVAALAAWGIYAMAKNKGLPKLWRAWIPFYNIVVLAEIAEVKSLAGIRTKHAGIFLMVLQILYAVNFIFNECTYVFNDALGFYAEQQQTVGDQIVTYVTPVGAGYVYVILSNLLIVLPAVVASFCLYLEVFRSYLPAAAMALCILTIVFPFVAPIALFAARNRKYVNYREYVQKRLEMIYGVPQHPVEKPKDPFSDFPDEDRFNPNSQRPARTARPSDDPFEEFSENNPYVDPARKTENGRENGEDGGKNPPPDDLFS